MGAQVDPWFLHTLFGVDDSRAVDRNRSEDEIFAAMDGNAYLTELYNTIQNVRYQRPPFCELQILREGDQESEFLLSSLLIQDNKNPIYQKDFHAFLNFVQGSGATGAASMAN